MTGPTQVPHGLLSHHFRQALFRADTGNQLATVAARCTPANFIGFHDMDVVTLFRQMQGRGDTGKPGANDADIGIVTTA